MSRTVVVIGYIIVIPTWFGMLAAALIFVNEFNLSDLDAWLRTPGAPPPQMILVCGFAIVLGITSLVAGLLGWLLVMKKHVLQCSVCKAVVNAS